MCTMLQDVQPIELRLDTMSCFQLAHYGLDLLRRAEPIIASESHPLFGHLRLMLKTHWRSPEQTPVLKAIPKPSREMKKDCRAF